MVRVDDGVVVLDALSAEILVGTLGRLGSCVLQADEPMLDELASLLGLANSGQVERVIGETNAVLAEIYWQLRRLAQAGAKIDGS